MENEIDVNQINKFLLEEYRKKAKMYKNQLVEEQRKCHEDKIKVLDKIRAEIDEQYERIHPYNIYTAEGLEIALEIIDKYKAESED